MVIPFMSLYMTQALHYTLSQAGMAIAIFGAGAICGGFLGGKLTDKVGFYNIQLAALVSGGSMFLILGQMRSFPAICSCMFVLAVLNESFRPANATAIAQYSKPENRTRSFSLNRLSINLGWAIGSAIGGFLASVNYKLLFWVDGFTNVGAAILLLLVLSPKRNGQTPSHKEISRKENTSAGSPWKDKLYMLFFILTIMFGFGFFQLFSSLPVFFKEVLHLSPRVIGATMAVNGLIIATVEMALVFHLEQKNRNLFFVINGVILTSLSFLVFVLFRGGAWLAMLSTIIVTFGEMLAMPFMNTFMVSRTNENNRGQYAGLYTAAWSVAQVLGPYLGTKMAEKYGYSVLWITTSAILLANAFGFKLLQLGAHKEHSALPPVAK